MQIEDWHALVHSDRASVRPVDAVDLVGDPAGAREALGWVPQVGFADLVGRMVETDLTFRPAPMQQT